MPDDPQHKSTPPIPLDYSSPSSNRQIVRRLMLFVIWMILSGVVIVYLIRVFRAP